MCLASKYLSEIESITTRLSNDKKRLYVKLSEYDKLVSEQYHKIEIANFNACEGYYLAKELQTILQKRRILKDEISRINSLQQIIDVNSIAEAISRSKRSLDNAKNKSAEWQSSWKHTYHIEEVLN